LGPAFKDFVQPYLQHQKDITTMTLVTLTASAKTFTDTPGFDITKMGHAGKSATGSSPSSSSPLGPTTFNGGQFTAMQAFTCPVHRSNHHALAHCRV
jgi:hypothetical protein